MKLYRGKGKPIPIWSFVGAHLDKMVVWIEHVDRGVVYECPWSY